MVRGLVPRQPAKSGRHEGRAVAARAPQSRGSSRQPKDGTQRRQVAVFARPQPKREPANKPKPSKGAGYNPTSPERIQEILKRLDQTYPGATCALHHKNAWELLVATILSAQCTDVRVNMVTPELFRKYPTIQDFASVSPEVLAADIRSTGFLNNQAKSIVGAAKTILNDFGAESPRTLEQLVSLPGV